MRSLFVIAAMIVGVAIAAPGMLNEWSGQAQGDDAARAAASVQSRGNNYRREVEVESHRNGHFYLDVAIEGRDVQMMVDTGASMVALRESDARSAGIRVRRGDFNMPVSTANGTTYYAPVTVRRVEIDGIEIRDVSAAVLPDDQLDISLLGASFLNQLRRFEVADNVLIMEN